VTDNSLSSEGLTENLSAEDAERLQIAPAVQGTEALLELAREAGVGTVVLTASNACMSGL